MLKILDFNPFCPLKGHTYLTNTHLSAAGLFKYVWPFSGQHLNSLKMYIIDNGNISSEHLNSSCLHQNKVKLQKQPPLAFYKKRCSFRNFTKFTEKLMCQSLFFNKVACLRHATLLEVRLWHRRFPVNFVKFLRTLFFTEHLWMPAS